MGKKSFLLAGVVAICAAVPAFSSEEAAESEAFEWGVVVGIGESKDDIDTYRVGLQRDFKKKWFSTEVGCLTGYHEASVGWWEKDGDNVQVIAYSPVFTYRFNMKKIQPYLEGGIGFSFISDQSIGERDMASSYQFEDRIGGGARFGKNGRHDLNFRYMHYSNASTQSPNDGIDILMGSYAFRF
jgi:lipid A 3-O-deacylase